MEKEANEKFVERENVGEEGMYRGLEREKVNAERQL